MQRHISENFIKLLKSEKLKPFLDAVQKDDTLDLELRGYAPDSQQLGGNPDSEQHGYDIVTIYYRGANLIDVKYNRLKDKCSINFNNKYPLPKIYSDLLAAAGMKFPDVPDGKDKPLTLYEQDADKAAAIIPIYKQAVDRYFCEKKYSTEKEFQQLIIWENNRSPIAAYTDYFILDIEYSSNNQSDSEEKNTGRFDLIAFRWSKYASKPILALIEMKYGDNAVGSKDGNGKDTKSGLKKHIGDFQEFLKQGDKFRHLYEDMVKVFRQKCDLGFIAKQKILRAAENYENLTDTEWKKLLNQDGAEISETEMLFILANHFPKSKRLRNELNDIQCNLPEALAEAKFALASGMGYGLYMDSIISGTKLMQLLEQPKQTAE